MKMYFVLLSVLIGIDVGVSAGADCSNYDSCFAFRNVQQIGIIGKKDNRFTYDDYKLAQNNMFKVNLTTGQIHSLTSGTGAFYCGGYAGGANLVLRNNLLLLDSHAILNYSTDDKNKCIGRLDTAELAKCQFRTIDGNGKLGDHPYFISPSSLRMGDSCSSDLSKRIAHDWAVVELQEVVEDANYYDVFDVKALATPDGDYNVLLGKRTISIAARNDNFKRDGALVNVPTICDDSIRRFWPDQDSKGRIAFELMTGCSNGHGNSGGAVIIPMGAQRPAIVSLMAWSGGADYEEYSYSNYIAGPLIEGYLAEVLSSCARKCPPVSK